MSWQRFVAVGISLALIAWGVWAITAAALGQTCTDTSPMFGFVVGVPLLVVGVGLLAASLLRSG